jgi:phosphate:Na+ symporter
MAGLADRIDSASFPGMTVLGIPALIIIGAVMTVVMQSSSAAVATTLAALYTGAIGIEQAAVLVIGQNIGTTVKAALAAIGASVPAKRTAMAHILFNVITGIIALALLPVFLWLAQAIARHGEGDAGAVSLAAFHTAFNVVGVMVFLPFITPYARLVERIVPERKPELARHLDASVAGVPSIAVEAVRRTAMDIMSAIVVKVRKLIDVEQTLPLSKVKLLDIEHAIDETKEFLGRVSTESASAGVFARHLSSVHAIDHLESLLDCCRKPAALAWAKRDESLRGAIHAMDNSLEPTLEWLSGERDEPPIEELRQMNESLAAIRRHQRALLLEQAALRKRPPKESLDLLDAFQWLDRVGYHLWRTAHHLQRTPQEKPESSAPELFAEGVSQIDESTNA